MAVKLSPRVPKSALDTRLPPAITLPRRFRMADARLSALAALGLVLQRWDRM